MIKYCKYSHLMSVSTFKPTITKISFISCKVILVVPSMSFPYYSLLSLTLLSILSLSIILLPRGFQKLHLASTSSYSITEGSELQEWLDGSISNQRFHCPLASATCTRVKILYLIHLFLQLLLRGLPYFWEGVKMWDIKKNIGKLLTFPHWKSGFWWPAYLFTLSLTPQLAFFGVLIKQSAYNFPKAFAFIILDPQIIYSSNLS